MKFLVIGGNAAGMSAASRVKRKSPDTEVVVLEQTHEVSYGACGLPYYVAGLNNNLDLMRIRKADQFLANGVDLRLGCDVTGADFTAKTVSYTDENGEAHVESYDKLLIATGSSPKVPPIPGIRQKNIFPLKTLDQAAALKLALESNPKSVVIVGGGYIGLELAEACILQKVPEIHIVEALDRLLNVFDPEFSEMVKTELEKNGVHIHLGERVMSFEGEDDKVTAVKTDKDCYAADVVILSIGVSPNTRFLPEGIEKLGNGAIVTDASMKTSVLDVYAAGDCASVWSKLLDKPMYIALGTNANKQGRLAGDAVLGKNVRFARALGTSMLRVMGMEFAKTGLGEQECKANGIDYKTTTVESRSHARYYPDPVTLTVKLTYRAADKVLLGAQIAGAKEAAVRIDTFACAVDQGMTTDELGFLDLGYAPPFASVWDAIAIAANASK